MVNSLLDQGDITGRIVFRKKSKAVIVAQECKLNDGSLLSLSYTGFPSQGLKEGYHLRPGISIKGGRKLTLRITRKIRSPRKFPSGFPLPPREKLLEVHWRIKREEHEEGLSLRAVRRVFGQGPQAKRQHLQTKCATHKRTCCTSDTAVVERQFPWSKPLLLSRLFGCLSRK